MIGYFILFFFGGFLCAMMLGAPKHRLTRELGDLLDYHQQRAPLNAVRDAYTAVLTRRAFTAGDYADSDWYPITAGERFQRVAEYLKERFNGKAILVPDGKLLV